MKKKILIIIFGLLFCLNGCSGYTPIYSSASLNFKIENYSIEGEKRLANLIYKKLYNSTLSNNSDPSARGISLNIKTTKEKKPTVKNSAGKILEYQIDLNTHVFINDFLNNEKILDKKFNYSISYKVQDIHSETVKLENKNIENLLDGTYQEILFDISEISSQ